MDYEYEHEDIGDEEYGYPDGLYRDEEAARLSDDIFAIARSQEFAIRSSGSLEDLSVERYASNWDDLEEYCSELSSRPGLSADTGESGETAMADVVHVQLENNHHVNGVEYSADSGGTDASEVEVDSQAENSNNNSSNNNNYNMNNSNNYNNNAIIVPPPRKKKMARLGKVEDMPKVAPKESSSDLHSIVNGDDDNDSYHRNDSSKMDIIYCNGESFNNHEQSEWNTNTGSSESARSESHEERESIINSVATNGKPAEKEIGFQRNQQRNNELNDCVRDIRKEKNLDEAKKNVIPGDGTSQTGLHSDNGSLACSHVDSSERLSDRDDLKFTTNNDDSAVNLAGTVKHAVDNVKDLTDTIPNGSDSTEHSPEAATVELYDVTLRADDNELNEGRTHKYKSESASISDYSRDLEEKVTKADVYQDEEREIGVDWNGDDDRCSQESKKTNSIYVDSADLEAIEGNLVVKPAVRRLSTSCDPNDDDDQKERDLKESTRMRRHSTAAIGHVENVALSLPCDYQEPSSGRSKSVTDLSHDLDIRKTRQHVHRNRSISRRVLSAVGKLSLRVRHVFKTKPDAEFEIGDDISSSTMHKSDSKQPQSSKVEKRHTSRLYMEVGGDYSSSKADSRKGENHRLDTETVHSYPDENRNPKPKGRFSTIFGLGGKRWHTISSLPKLFHLKRKSKDKKEDKMSTVSEFETDTISSVASAPVRGRNRFLIANGRYAANAKDKIAGKQHRRYDADSSHDLPTFISLEEYRRRAKDAEYKRQLAETEREKRQNGLGKRCRSLPYLDTSEEEEQGFVNVKYNYGTKPPPRPDRRRTKPRPESYDDSRRHDEEVRHRQDVEPHRCEKTFTDNMDTIERGDRRRRYRRREKPERPPSRQEVADSHEEIDKSTMKIDYGYDIYHFQDHPRLLRPQSISDVNFISMADVNETPTGHSRYSTQPRVRHSVAEPEERGRRRLPQPRDRTSIAVANGRIPEKSKRAERIQRPKSMSALPADDSLSSDATEATNTQRHRRNPRRLPSPSPSPPPRRHNPSPDVNPIEDAIAKHLKHERGPLARRKLERKRSIESGSMQRLKESFMAKRIWESVYDQLLKDLSSNPNSNNNGGVATLSPKKPDEMQPERDDKASTSRLDEGYYSTRSSHSSREETDSKAFSRSTSIDEEVPEPKEITKISKLPRTESCRDTLLRQPRAKKNIELVEEDDDDDGTKSVAYEPMSLTLTRPGRRVWRPTQK